MKILICGDWHSNLHEEPLYNSFSKLGHEVYKFKWHKFYSKSNSCIISLFNKIENKYMIGPTTSKLNKQLLIDAELLKPDLIFIYRGSHIYKNTLIHIKNNNPKSIIIGYNNDDPFSNKYPWWLWRHFMSCIPFYDLVCAYRFHNLSQLQSYGAKNVKLLRSWFVPEYNFPLELTNLEKNKFETDVVFIGHFEDDGRLQCLESIYKAGFKLKLFGHNYSWNRALKKSVLHFLTPLVNVWGEEYNKALNGAKIALCFMSKLNRDTYTRRCFEIPASGVLLLSEYTEDLAKMFVPDVEAVFFKTQEELNNKIKFLLENDEKRIEIAQNGLRRVWLDKHDVNSRAVEVIKWSGLI